jgi:hypothetical protein
VSIVHRAAVVAVEPRAIRRPRDEVGDRRHAGMVANVTSRSRERLCRNVYIVMRSAPPRYARSALGIVTLPSAFW